MATIKDVCELAQVSKSTVSRALTGHPSIAEKTKKKVLKAIEELNFRPNAAARSLASKRTHSIGMLVITIDSPYFSSMVSSAEEVARYNGFHLIPTSGYAVREYDLDVIKFLQSKQVDGLIIHSGGLSDNDILGIIKEIPATILLNRYIPEIAENCIVLDNVLGGYLATKHLLENGHTEIGCITGSLHQIDCQERLQGYRNALAEHGIKYDENLIIEGHFSLENNNLAPIKLLDRDTQLTAIFCLNDHIALGVYDVLKERNIGIGEDISVIGYDNSDFSTHICPKLTTVNVPTKEMGTEATRKALAIINDSEYVMKDKLLPELICRNSVKNITQAG